MLDGGVVARWKFGLICCVALSTLCACAERVPEIDTGQIEADSLLFERGTTALEEGDWRVARQYFVQIRDNYPQSQYRAGARIGIGETYEQEGSFEASLRALEEFQDSLSLYPTHPRAPYAQYMVGVVHFQQMRRAERDQTETRNAISAFEAFISQYPPDHELMPQVRDRLRDARDRLSEHDFTVGRFYHRIGTYAGAISRFRQILNNDPAYTRRDEVYFYLADSLANLQQTAEAIPYYARILEEFDASEYGEDAQIRLTELEAEAAAAQDR